MKTPVLPVGAPQAFARRRVGGLVTRDLILHLLHANPRSHAALVHRHVLTKELLSQAAVLVMLEVVPIAVMLMVIPL